MTQCNNECGSGWCCSCWDHYFRGADTAILAKNRGLKVYKVPVADWYVAVIPNIKCKYLSKRGRCKIEKTKPQVCRDHPINGGIVHDKCPYVGANIFRIGDLEEV